jgi:hypothetical protein
MRRANHSGNIILQVIFVLFITVAALSAALLIARNGPSRPERVRPDAGRDKAEIEELKREGESDWERFVNMSTYRDQDKYTDEDIELLRRAIAKSEEYLTRAEIRGIPSDPGMQIEKMRKTWANIQAAKLREESFALQREGESARDKGDLKRAAELFEQAIACEKKIDSDYRIADKVTDIIQRVSQLNTAAKYARGHPIWKESGELEKDGDALFLRKEWEAAREKFNSALEQEEVLSTKYQGIFTSEYMRGEKLRTKRDTAASGVENEQLLQLVNEAAQLADSGRYAEAAKVWDTIDARYDDIRRLHPRSEYVRKDALETRAKVRDFMLAAPQVEALRKRVKALDDALRDGRLDGVAGEARAMLQEERKIQDAYAGALLLGIETERKLSYINIHGNDFPLIRRKVLEGLKPLPGAPGIAMFATEVPQELYAIVMDGENPSAVRNDTGSLPVDSVAHVEAQEFCRRINWMLGDTTSDAELEDVRPLLAKQLAELRAVGTANATKKDAYQDDFFDSFGAGRAAGRGKREAAAAAAKVEQNLTRAVSRKLAVRLPAVDEFRRAAGDVQRAGLDARAWSFENSGNAPHGIGGKAANAAGFYDLLGNLSEWADASEFADTAPEFGGNYQDNLNVLAALPVGNVSRRDKSRLRGFRFLVDKNQLAAGAAK